MEKVVESEKTTPPDTTGLHEIVNQARTILVNRNVSARSRALLMLIIDLANEHYEPLTGDLQIFYSTILGMIYWAILRIAELQYS